MPAKKTTVSIQPKPEWFTIAAAVKELQPAGRYISARTLTAAMDSGKLKYVQIDDQVKIPRSEIERLQGEYETFLRDTIGRGDPAVAKFLDGLTPAERAAPEKALGKWLMHWQWRNSSGKA